MNPESKIIYRDHFIDLARGVCTLSIVFIHTVFWSGSSYVPTYFAVFSLLLDVPSFFFLSGMSFAVTKKDNIVSGIFRLSTTFGLLAFLYDIAFSKLNFHNTLLALTLNAPNLRYFPVVMGSYWFVPVYVVVSIFGTLIIKKMQSIYVPLLITLFCYFPFDFFMGKEEPQFSVLSVNISFLIFYLFLYLFGYFAKERIIYSNYKKYFSLGVCLIGICLFLMAYYKVGVSALDLQSSKFPILKLPYASASLISISGIIYLYTDAIRLKWLEYIGKNSIFYYAAQGVGSSILINIVNKFNFQFWEVKLLIMFSINLLLTAMIAEGLKYTYKFLANGFQSAVKYASNNRV